MTRATGKVECPAGADAESWARCPICVPQVRIDAPIPVWKNPSAASAAPRSDSEGAGMNGPPGTAPALVIAGMHRSGTSLAASLVAAAGVHIGDQLMGPAAGNPRGHFEDLEFYRLHQRVLDANGLSRDGFTCQEVIEVPARARAKATALVDRRRAAGRAWGWKDPRSTLFLDFWAEVVPESRFLLLVRPPWEVVDSLFRRGDDPFALNPRFTVDVWSAYNRRVRDFARGHADRCLVVEAAAVAADPTGFVGRVADLLAVPLARPTPQFEPGLLITEHGSHRRTLVEALRPDAAELLGELRLLAGAEPEPPPPAPRAEDVAAAALVEWAAAAEAMQAAADRSEEARLREDLAVAQSEAAALADQIQAEREIHEAVRCDLTARLERAAAAGGRGHERPIGRKSLGGRIVAEGRRFARRIGGRRRRCA
jgi:hypothetical protein